MVLPVEHDPREGCAAMGGWGDLGVYLGPPVGVFPLLFVLHPPDLSELTYSTPNSAQDRPDGAQERPQQA